MESWRLQALVPTRHVANIFSAEFLPCTADRQVVSIDAAGLANYMMDVGGRNIAKVFMCQQEMGNQVVVDNDNPTVFLACGDDGFVRQYDLREKIECDCNGCEKDVLLSNCVDPATDRRRKGVPLLNFFALQSKPELKAPPSCSIGCNHGIETFCGAISHGWWGELVCPNF